MGSTYLSLHYHLVWGTKERQQFIEPVWEPRLHAFLGGAFREAGGFPEAINGMADHVHVLVGLRATHRLSDVMADVKRASSRWVHEELRWPQFAWQDGYAAFTVGVSQLPQVKGYIAKQKQHHAEKLWPDELKELLEKAGIVYDEKYLV